MAHDPISPFAHLRSPQSRVPLAAEKEAVARAEETLERARTALRAAAKAKNIELAGLLGETKFVPRAIADGWVTAAHTNGIQAVLGALKYARENEGKSCPIPWIGDVDTTSPEYRAETAQLNAIGDLMKSPALAKFAVKKRARIAIAWMRAENDEPAPKDKPMPNQSNIHSFAQHVVNLHREAHNLPPLKPGEFITRAETDEGNATLSRDGKNSDDATEEFARRVVEAHRKAMGLPPLKPGEFIKRKVRDGE
jgi:nitrogen fixation protein FixH